LERLVGKSFKDLGGTVAAQSIELGAPDVREQINALKGQDAIFIATLGAGLTSAVRQLRETRYGGSVLVPSAGAVPTYFTLPEMQSVYVSAPMIYNPSYLYAREASDKFTARYNKPFNVYAANSYDFIKLISGLLEDRHVSRQSVQEVLAAGFDYSGVFGPVRMRPGENELAFPLYPAQILNNAIKFR
jgi:ABC-type branched-subunit amino acid transport system substrate-binding protein